MNINFKYYKPKLLITIILILGTGINLVFQQLELFPLVMRFPTTGSIIIAILLFYDKCLWKYRFFNKLINVPNFEGRYKGKIEFYHPIKKTKGQKECTMIITQTASKIMINTFFHGDGDDIENTHSVSKVSNIIKEDENTYAIIFTYWNEGTPGKNKYSPYYGSNYIKLIQDTKNKLEGFYYTNRIPQTKGDISLEYINKNLNHPF